MTLVEGIFLWGAVFCLAVAFIARLAGVVFRTERLVPLSSALADAGMVLLTGTVALRWWETGHPPVMGIYENSLLGAWFVVLTLVIARRRFPKGGILSLVVLPAVLLMLGNGIMAKSVLAPLEPPYQSGWLYVHVLFAWFAFSSYLVASTVAVLYLLKERGGRGRVREALPPPATLDDVCLRLVIFGFITDAVMMGTGAIWAHGLWGRYWGWDPIETWSLITWLIYGINLHLRLTLGWGGRKAAWLTVVSFAAMLVTFLGVGSVHTQIMGG